MSLLVSSSISDMNLELNLVGQRMADTDYILFLDRARKFFYTGYKMPTTEREFDLVVYAGARENAIPSDFIGLIEPKRPDGEWSPKFDHQRETDLVHWPYGRSTSLSWDKENQFLIVNDSSLTKTNLNSCDSLTTGGTWAITGDGSNLALDQQIFTEGNGSLRFTVTASAGSTTLTCTSLSQVDITDILTDGRFFLNLQTPSSNTVAISSIALKIGTSASAYYQMSATTRHRGDSILNGWGPISFDPSTKTTVGSPTDTDIEYIQIVITHGVTGVNGTYRLDDIWGARGTYYLIPYYSKYNVKDTNNLYKERVTATDDTILCPSDFDECFIYKTLEMAAAIRLRDSALATYFSNELKPKVVYLASKYPRQEKRLSTNYYKKVSGF